jgi:hypothetical protein
VIVVEIRRAELDAREACREGLRLFDAIAGLAGTPGLLCVEWSPLAQVWLGAAGPLFAFWLYEQGLVPQVSLRGADLGGADLRGAYLRGAYLGAADLGGADLGGADLRGADLRGADLRGADLRGAYLRGAYLGAADLRGADLRGADLRGAFRRDEDAAIDGWTARSGILRRMEPQS